MRLKSERLKRDSFKSDRGSTAVEMLMVVALLALFGITICSLIVSGIGTYNKISNKRESMVNGRIAMSFLNVRIRQNDEQGAITIAKCPVTGEDALKVVQTFEENDEEYTNWIYFYEGTIYETLIKSDMEPSLDISNAIVDMEEFSLHYKDGAKNAIVMKGRYIYNDKVEEMTSVITLRSEPSGEDSQ